MAIENQQDDTGPAPAPVSAEALGTRGVARRRFARAGAGATGVLLTLASQPGMACSVCMSPSGYQSYSKTMKAASHKTPVTCAGLPPSTWRSLNSWPTGCTKTTLFSKVFTVSAKYASTYGTATAYNILGGQSFDSSRVGMYLMAAYLNVLSGRSTFLTVEIVRAIWTEYQLKGTYTPMAGATPWTASDIVAYLYGTMD